MARDRTVAFRVPQIKGRAAKWQLKFLLNGDAESCTEELRRRNILVEVSNSEQAQSQAEPNWVALFILPMNDVDLIADYSSRIADSTKIGSATEYSTG